jgi:large repetitive protein
MNFTDTIKLFSLLLIVFGAFTSTQGQTSVFANLNGNAATMNTSNWSVLGNANILGNPNLLDTNGDPDANANELQLALVQNNSAGGIFFNGSMDLTTTCDYWIADFDLRMFEGASYDGMAFIVTSAVPTSTPTTSGSLLGMPIGGFTGFSICMDGFNNCGGAAPNLEIRYNTTDECAVGPTVSVPSLIQNAYNNFKVLYKNGIIEVYINGALAPNLTGNYNLTGPCFFGFTAANGATANGKYALKNASIYTIQPVVDAGLDVTGCIGGAGALLGASPLQGYSYSWTPGSNLSDSLISNPVVTYTASGVIADTASYILTGTIGTCQLTDTVDVVSVPVPAAPVVTGPTAAVCEGTSVVLTATPAANEQVKWFAAASGGAALFTGYNFTTPFLTTNTTYYAEAINNTICSSPTRTAFTIVVNAAPVAPTASAAKICEGKDGIFIATAPLGATYSWFTSPTSGLSIYIGSTANLGAIYTDTTLYVSATNGLGCSSIALTPVTLQVDVTPPTPTMITDTVCKGLSATISAISGAGNTIKWYVAQTSTTPLFVGATYNTPALSQNTFYYANATTNIGCVGAMGSLVVGVLDRPDTTIAVWDTICPGQIAQLGVTPNSNTVYRWYDSPTATVPLFVGNTYNVAIGTTTVFYIESKVGSCTSLKRAYCKGIVDYFPPAPVVDNESVCPGGRVDLRVKSPGDAIAHFAWYNSANQLLYEGRNYTINNVTTPMAITVKSLSFLANCPNENNKIVNVTLNPVPTAHFTITPDTVEVNEPVYFEDSSFSNISTSAGLSYFWDLGDGNYSTIRLATFTFPQEGLFPVTLVATNSKGCSDTITQNVLVYDIREIYIPTAFTPNNDYHNDKLTILAGINTKAYSVKIFDRWGRIVFTSTSPNYAWDGKDMKNGEAVPEGVYMCLVEYTTAKGVKKVLKEGVTLIR